MSCAFVFCYNAKNVRLVCGTLCNSQTIVDIKKSYKADLDNHRASGFLLGLVVVMSLFLVALEFTTSSNIPEADDDILDDVSHDIEMAPAIHHDAIVAARAAKAQQAVTSDKLNLIDHAVETEQNQIPTVDDQRLTDLLGVGIGGVADISDTAIPTITTDSAQDSPISFQIVERLPEFPGGMSAFVQWLTKNLKYPLSAQRAKKQGTVLVSFIINKDGSVTDRKVVRSAGAELDREALRVIRIMPKWEPGENRGKPCRTYFCIPIVFKL